MTDVVKDVKSKSDFAILNVAKKIKDTYEDGVDLNSLLIGEDVNGEKYEICEINIVGSDGIIKKSTNKDYEGFNFYNQNQPGSQSKEFLVLLGEKDSLVQDFTKNAILLNGRMCCKSRFCSSVFEKTIN